jgi:hypothetical protein
VVLNLKEARKLFDTLRDGRRVLIKRHAFADHPGRKFTHNEVLALVLGNGVLRSNHVSNPAPNSFVLHCQDDRKVHCQLAVVFDTDENGQIIVVISSYREIG